MVTRDGERTLTIQNAQAIRGQMNAERQTLKDAKMSAAFLPDSQSPFLEDTADEYGQDLTESQLNAIGTSAYQERADLEVEALNDWERQHLGGGTSDSEDDM